MERVVVHDANQGHAEGVRPAGRGARLLDWIAEHRAITIIALLALYVAVALVHHVPHGTDDEGGYLAYAQALIDGRYGSHSPRGEYLHWGPGIPILLAPWMWIDAPLELVRMLFGPAMLAAVVLVLWTALIPEVGRRAATVAALLCAAYWPAWMALGMVLSEPATALFLTLGLWAWLASRRRGSLPLAAASGAALGFAALIRVEFGWVIVAGLVVSLVLLAVKRNASAARSATAAAVALLVCLPWLAYTHDQTAYAVFWGTSGGQNLYWTAASKPPFQGEWIDVRAAFDDPNYAPYWPKLRAWERLDPPAQDAAYQHAAVEAIKADPGVFIVNMGKGAARMVVNLPFSFERFDRRRVALTLFYGVPNTIALIAVIGIAVLLTRRRRWAAIAAAPVFVVATNLLEHLPLAALPRHLLPVMPSLIWFAVAGWVATRPADVTKRL